MAEATRAVQALRSGRRTARRAQLLVPGDEHRKAVAAALEGLGLEVREAGPGAAWDAEADALVLSASLVDSALADRVAAAREARPQLQVLVVSDRRSLDDDIAALQVGARALVPLPLEPRALRESLAGGLGLLPERA